MCDERPSRRVGVVSVSFHQGRASFVLWCRFDCVVFGSILQPAPTLDFDSSFSYPFITRLAASVFFLRCLPTPIYYPCSPLCDRVLCQRVALPIRSQHCYSRSFPTSVFILFPEPIYSPRCPLPSSVTRFIRIIFLYSPPPAHPIYFCTQDLVLFSSAPYGFLLLQLLVLPFVVISHDRPSSTFCFA